MDVPKWKLDYSFLENWSIVNLYTPVNGHIFKIGRNDDELLYGFSRIINFIQQLPNAHKETVVTIDHVCFTSLALGIPLSFAKYRKAIHQHWWHLSIALACLEREGKEQKIVPRIKSTAWWDQFLKFPSSTYKTYGSLNKMSRVMNYEWWNNKFYQL